MTNTADMTTTPRRSAPEKIADLVGADISEVIDGRYQPGTIANPAVFVVGDDYFAACETEPKHRLGLGWKKHLTFRGDVVWESEMGELL